MRILFLFLPFVSAELLHSMYEIQAQSQLPKREGRLQGVSVRGRLICGSRPLVGVQVKIVDVDKRPDKDDLMGDVQTADDGEFHISGATREQTQIDVLMKIYHDCLDDEKPCQRKTVFRIPPQYYNNGTFTEWFDIGTLNLEINFLGEERDCRH
ncbi:hypothetical protein M3Y98_00072500 [Aphelenchoides besseyi]|nr:hypothetical protein M3Y98_00072500 [Aphelenchoides besseyi]KAI6198741.1 hypothetical protein M3Y96_00551600 [Aphelenchoides besseyi]